jgi:glucans biosynthesis protein C
MYLAQLHRSGTPGSYLEYYPTFFQLRPPGMPDYTGIGFSWGHLWFILDLFAISLIALPVFLGLKTRIGKRLIAGSADFLARGPALLLAALLVPFVAFLLPQVDNKPFFTYLLVFIYGFALMADARYREVLTRNRRLTLVLAIVCMSILFTVWLSGVHFADFSLASILLYFVEKFSIWFWLMAILGFGDMYMNADSAVLRYAREAAYPFYILHQTVIVAIGFFVVQWQAAPLLKWLAIAGSSLVVSVGLYDLLVRRTNVTRFLFGMKPLARRAARGVVSPAGPRGG